MAGARIVAKSGHLWTVLHYAVLLVTLGRNRRFLTGYATTIGPWIALPPDWLARRDEPRIRYLLVHEQRHVEQARRLGLGSPVLGILPMAILYLLLPLPLALAYFRWRFEREAYADGFRAELADLEPARAAERRRHLIDFATEQLSGGAYGWAWMFKGQVRRWLEEHV